MKKFTLMRQHSLTILGASVMYQVSLIHNFVWQKVLYHLTISHTKCDLIISNFDLYVKRLSSRVPFETFLNSTLCQSVSWFC